MTTNGYDQSLRPDAADPGRIVARYGFALAATIVAYLARLCADPIAKDRYPFGAITIATVLVAWHSGFGPSLVPYLLGYLMADYSFVDPRQSFRLENSAHLAGTVTYLFVGLSIILFGRSMHAARERANAHAREAIQGQKRLAQEAAERRAAEEQVRKLNTELEGRVQARTAELIAANQELEAFTYSVSHDLRAPLRHVDGYAQILEEEFAGQLPPEALKYAAKIRLGSRNMGRLVDDLLALSRVGKSDLHWERVVFRPLIEEVIGELGQEVAGRNIQWRIGDLPPVECDRGLVKQLFANLLANSAKYTRPRDPAEVEIDQTRVGDDSVFFVRDNGVGFNMKYVDKLFGVFQRLHRHDEFEGTGVGLATVSRIVRKHGGRIWAEAEENHGATFFFTLAPGTHRE